MHDFEQVTLPSKPLQKGFTFVNEQKNTYPRGFCRNEIKLNKNFYVKHLTHI